MKKFPRHKKNEKRCKNTDVIATTDTLSNEFESSYACYSIAFFPSLNLSQLDSVSVNKIQFTEFATLSFSRNLN